MNEHAPPGSSILPATALRLGLFGQFQFTIDGRPVTFSAKRSKALLAILALSPSRQASRERLCGLLWSDSTDDLARTSLRQCLTILRRETPIFGDHVLQTVDDMIALVIAPENIDVLEFQRLAANSDLESLRRAAAIFGSPLLGDLFIRDEGFEDWLATERRKFTDLAIETFEKLASAEQGQSRISAAKQLLALDRLREASHRTLINAYESAGDIALALKQFKQLSQMLKSEFDVEPSADSLELRDRILRSQQELTAKSGRPQIRVTETAPQAETPVESTSPEPSGGWVAQPISQTKPKRIHVIGLAAIVSAILAAVAFWSLAPSQLPVPGSKVPVVAVLPLSTTAANGELAYLGNGVSEDLISMLARSPDVKVLSRSSSFTKKGDAREIGKQLAADYLIEGTIRQAGGAFDVSIQLVRTENGQATWSDQYSIAGGDIWRAQEEISKTIVARLSGETGELQKSLLSGASPARSTSIGEYEYYLRGQEEFNLALAPAGEFEGFERAADIWRQGLSIYPDSPLLKVKLGFYHLYRILNFTSTDYFADADRAVVLATQALQGASSDPAGSSLVNKLAHWLLARAYSTQGRSAEAIAEAEIAVRLAPFDANMLGNLAATMIENGQVERGLEWIETAAAREPGAEAVYDYRRGWANTVLGNSDEALIYLKRSNLQWTDIPLLSAINYVRLGKQELAAKEIANTIKLDPEMSQKAWRKGYVYSDPQIMADQIKALALAGLPE